MTKAERAEICGNAMRWPDTERCKRSILSFLTALDEKYTLIADAILLAYQAIAYEMDSDDAHAQLAELKARAAQ